jgi:hypothetical protein
MSDSIADQLAAAVAARKDSLKALRLRLAEILAPIPVGTKLSDARPCEAPDGMRDGTEPHTVAGPYHTKNCACGGTGELGGLILKVVRVCSGASQWSNRTWEVTIKGIGYLSADNKVVAEDLDGTYCDGSNMHHRTSEPTCLWDSKGYMGDHVGDALSYLSGKETRALATRLPAAIAAYMRDCEAERAANERTAV